MEFNIDMDTPFEELPEEHQAIILNGSNGEMFHFHYENDFGGVRTLKYPLKEFFLISNVAIMKPIVISPGNKCVCT